MVLAMAMRPRQRDPVTGRTGLGSDPPSAFRQVQVTVLTEAGEKVLVTTYAATPIGKFKPKAHYLDWVMKGLKHWKLPEEAIETWKSYVPQ